MSGPLFGDTDAIEFKYREHLWSVSAKKLTEVKCSTCGYPNCACSVCIYKNAHMFSKNRSKQTSFHTCALQGVRQGAPPKAGWYSLEQEASRYKAWEEVGADAIPSFHKGNGWSGYFFPQELQDA